MFCDDKVGTRLTDMRAARNVSQAQLAEAVGIAATQLHRYESGRVLPRPTTLAKLAQALGVSNEWLARGEKGPASSESNFDFGPGARAGSDYEEITLKAPAGFARRIAALASSNGRSFNAEAISRLEWALSLLDAPKKVEGTTPTTTPLGGELTWNITAEIKQYAEQHSISFDEALAKIFVAGLHPEAPEVFYLLLAPGTTKDDMRAALEASDSFTRKDATVMIENLGRAPWTPRWLADRLKEIDAAYRDKDGSVTLLQAKQIKPPPKHDLVKPAVVKRVSRKPPASKKNTKS